MQEAILAEARRVVSEDGVDALSVRGIARALGYSSGALYEYFRDKEAIIHGLYFNGTSGLGRRLADVLAAVPDDTPLPGRIAILGRAYRAYALEHPELYRLAFGRIAPPGRPEQGAGGFEVLVEVMEAGLARGILVEDRPESHALACWSGVHGFVSLELSGHLPGGDPAADSPGSADMRHVRDALFERLMRALLLGIVREDARAESGLGPEAGTTVTA
jgi:AcrR family transcriptional regulator